MMDTPEIDRQQMEVDIACVGFGPATGGFLTTLTRGLMKPDGTPVAESKAMPGMPPQVSCYERADDIGLGVSGVVTKGEAIKASFPDQELDEIPMSSKVTGEKVAYLLDPIGASRRSGMLRVADTVLTGEGTRLRVFHGAILPMGRWAGHGNRNGPDLAWYAR
jgi:electron-transferring-flavoprotein dehydrogenase